MNQFPGVFARNRKEENMLRKLFLIVALCLPWLALASEFGGMIFGGASTCAGADTFGPQNPVLGVATGSAASGPCTIPKIGTFTASASASVDLLGVSPEIQGQATTTGPLIGGFTAAAAAGVTATYFDTVHLISPVIDFRGGVDVVAGDSYSLNISNSAPLHPMDASVTFSVVSINGEPVSSPATYQQMVSQSSDGSYSGNLSVEFTILACPCSFEFQVDGTVSGGGSSSGSFHDPFFINLPDGWSYTLASQEAVSTPEPNSLALVALGMIAFCGMLRRMKTHRAN
jgi:hypothetical protein